MLGFCKCKSTSALERAFNAGSISGEWNAAETAIGLDLTLFSSRTLLASSRAETSPDIMHCLGEFKLARVTSLRCAMRRRTSLPLALTAAMLPDFLLLMDLS